MPAAHTRSFCSTRAENDENVRPLDNTSSTKVSGTLASAARISTIDADTGPPAISLAHRGDDHLAEHLAPLDHGAPPVRPRHADVAAVTGRAHVHHVDQIGGVAPVRELHDRARRVRGRRS